MFDCQQFRTSILVPVLSMMQAFSNDAEELMVFTCAAESMGGTYLHQKNGQALGIYQMEPNTYTDLWCNFIQRRTKLNHLLILQLNCNRIPPVDRLIYDLYFATAMTRAFYMRVTEALPDSKDVDAMWDYYKKFYNTPLGKAQKDETIKRYQAFRG